jgi:hypothetical protein
MTAAAFAQARSGTIDIDIIVPSAESAHVEERYTLSSPAKIELRVLARACVTIENLRIERGGVTVDAVRSRNDPWITFRDSTASGSDSVIVRYDVRLARTGIIPLVHLAAPLERSSSARLGAVTVEVRFADATRRVEFPHMTRQAPSHWSARYVGVPSFVEFADGATTECVEQTGEGDNGGLVWRFFLLVGIMVAWVPLYLAWARRSGESA